MSKQVKCILSLALLLSITCNVIANNYNDTINVGDPNNHKWCDPNNWLEGEFNVVPNISNGDGSQWAHMRVNGTICIVDETSECEVSAAGIHVGSEGGDNEMHINGGTVTTQFFDVGRGGNNATYDGGTTYGHLTVTGGVITATHWEIPNQWAAPPVISGEVTMTGGEVNLSGNLNIGKNAGVGHLDFQGGTINCGAIFINTAWVPLPGDPATEEGSMDLSGGVLICDNNHTENIQDYIDAGWITFYGVAPTDVRYYQLDYDVTNAGKTTLTAIDPITIVFEKAWGPTPKDRDIVDITDGNLTLTWHAGDGGPYQHDVYFGTTETPGNIGEQAGTNYIAAANLLDTTYYWQINEIDGGTTYTGPVWRFTTADFMTVDDFDPNDLSPWTDTGSVTTELVANNVLSMQISCGAGLSGSSFRTPPQNDWDQQELKALRVSFFGNASNNPSASLSLTINSATINFTNDNSQLQTAIWTQWNVSYEDLSSLGVNLDNVTKVEINVTSGASDLILDVDNIELAQFQCVNQPETDVNGDCEVNLLDTGALGNEWMNSGYTLP